MIKPLSLFLAIFLAGGSYAQIYATSPFSSKGLGEAGGLEDPQFGGLGSCRTGIYDSTTVNNYNPASYSALSKGQPLLAIGLSARISTYKQNSLSSKAYLAGLNQITLAIPVSRRIGFAVGLQPFARKGYALTQTYPLGDDSVRYTYHGGGTIQQVLGGLSYRIIDTKKQKLALGFSYSYLFGSVSDERRAEAVSTLAGNGYGPGGIDKSNYRVVSGYYSAGVQYHFLLDSTANKQLTLGAVYTPQQDIRGYRDYFQAYAGNTDSPGSYDTLQFVEDDKGTITYPSSMSFGFNYTFRPPTEEQSKFKTVYQLNIYGDYTGTQWSSYSTSFRNDSVSAIFSNTSRFSLGVQFTPHYNFAATTASKSFIRKIRYRAGVYYGTLPYSEGGKQLTEAGASIGFGVPAGHQRRNSSLNLSVQYGQRSNGTASGLKEQYLGINFGIIVAPALNDLWFRRYKLD